MKLRNLIFSLFLAIGAIGFTACTGDDGATGPAGPAGPQGPPGEPAEPGDAGSASAFYDFLKSWGSETGEVACDDSILTGSGSLPGDGMVELKAIVTRDDTLDANIAPTCGTVLFAGSSFDPDGPTGATPAIDIDANALLLYKTVRGAAEPEEVDTPSSEFNKATKTTTNKVFVGGVVAAEMNTIGGADEPLERGHLYNNCGVGTPPADIRGMWRAVEITTSEQAYENGEANDDDPVTTRTLKVCVTLDSIPGTTKCYVKMEAGGMATEQIALYDGTALHPVEGKGPTDGLGTVGTEAAELFEDESTEGDLEAAKLCHLFDEG